MTQCTDAHRTGKQVFRCALAIGHRGPHTYKDDALHLTIKWPNQMEPSEHREAAFRITTLQGFTFGIIIDKRTRRVIRAAPIARWTVGMNGNKVRKYYMMKGGKTELLTEATAI